MTPEGELHIKVVTLDLFVSNHVSASRLPSIKLPFPGARTSASHHFAREGDFRGCDDLAPDI